MGSSFSEEKNQRLEGWVPWFQGIVHESKTKHDIFSKVCCFFLLNILFPGFVMRWLEIDEKVSLGGVSTIGSYIQDISNSIYSDFHSDFFFKGPVHVVFFFGK